MKFRIKIHSVLEELKKHDTFGIVTLTSTENQTSSMSAIYVCVRVFVFFCTHTITDLLVS